MAVPQETPAPRVSSARGREVAEAVRRRVLADAEPAHSEAGRRLLSLLRELDRAAPRSP